jgi:hypothetical protein
MSWGDILPVLIVGLVFVFIMTFLILVNRFQKRERELIHAERMAAIEKGLPLPEGAFSAPNSGDAKAADEIAALQEALKPVPGNSFKSGIALLLLGTGLIAAFLLAQPGWGHWAWGLVLALLGAADLIYWFVSGRAEWKEAQALRAEARQILMGRLKPASVDPRSDQAP